MVLNAANAAVCQAGLYELIGQQGKGMVLCVPERA
jgi:hypothetical protein